MAGDDLVSRNPDKSDLPMKGINETPTQIDLDVLDLIIECGFVFRSLTGDPYLQSGRKIARERFDRLVELGLVKPNEGESMFGAPSQTYKPTTEDWDNDERFKRLLDARRKAGRSGLTKSRIGRVDTRGSVWE